jgi:hypothetical protein
MFYKKWLRIAWTMPFIVGFATYYVFGDGIARPLLATVAAAIIVSASNDTMWYIYQRKYDGVNLGKRSLLDHILRCCNGAWMLVLALYTDTPSFMVIGIVVLILMLGILIAVRFRAAYQSRLR